MGGVYWIRTLQFAIVNHRQLNWQSLKVLALRWKNENDQNQVHYESLLQIPHLSKLYYTLWIIFVVTPLPLILHGESFGNAIEPCVSSPLHVFLILLAAPKPF